MVPTSGELELATHRAERFLRQNPALGQILAECFRESPHRWEEYASAIAAGRHAVLELERETSGTPNG